LNRASQLQSIYFCYHFYSYSKSKKAEKEKKSNIKKNFQKEQLRKVYPGDSSLWKTDSIDKRNTHACIEAYIYSVFITEIKSVLHTDSVESKYTYKIKYRFKYFAESGCSLGTAVMPCLCLVNLIVVCRLPPFSASQLSSVGVS